MMAANNSESLVMTPPPPSPHACHGKRSSFRLAFGFLFCGSFGSAGSCVTLGMIVNLGIIVYVRYCAARAG